MKLSAFARYAWSVLAVNLGVILWGAFVRATGAGAGCGSHWPLCNGQVVPLAPQIETLIEFIHRLSSGAAFVLVIGMAIWAWRAYPAGHRVRGGAFVAVLGMMAESLAGASLVLFRWVALDISIGRIVMMPIHLIITFVLLASLALTAWWASGGLPFDLKRRGKIFWMLIVALIGVVILSMAGALTALGDTVLPVPTLTAEAIQNLSPLGQFLVNLRVAHPLIAIGVGAYVLLIVRYWLNASNDALTRRLTQLVGVLFLVQLGAGLLNVYLQAPVWMQITHLLLADVVWIVLILLTATQLAKTSGGV
jgi:heme A synthase